MTRMMLGTVGTALLVSGIVTAQSRAAVPVATIAQIQRAMISPSSDVIFNVGRAAPASDEEWAAVENAAVILTEAGNLFMMGGAT